MKKRLATLRESAAAIAAHLSTARLARLVPLLEMLLQARTGAPPLATSTRSYSQNPAAIRQRRHRERLRTLAGDERNARNADSDSHTHTQRGNGAESVTPRYAAVTPRPSSSSSSPSALASSSPEEKKQKQEAKNKQPSAAEQKADVKKLGSIWGKSASKHGTSSIFRGNPKQLFAILNACDGDVVKYTERVALYHRECALARRTPSVDDLAEDLKKILRAKSPHARNGASRNGAAGAHLQVNSEALQREAGGRKIL